MKNKRSLSLRRLCTVYNLFTMDIHGDTYLWLRGIRVRSGRQRPTSSSYSSRSKVNYPFRRGLSLWRSHQALRLSSSGPTEPFRFLLNWSISLTPARPCNPKTKRVLKPKPGKARNIVSTVVIFLFCSMSCLTIINGVSHYCCPNRVFSS